MVTATLFRANRTMVSYFPAVVAGEEFVSLRFMGEDVGEVDIFLTGRPQDGQPALDRLEHLLQDALKQVAEIKGEQPEPMPMEEVKQ